VSTSLSMVSIALVKSVPGGGSGGGPVDATSRAKDSYTERIPTDSGEFSRDGSTTIYAGRKPGHMD
jgi:hypothetical protein